MNLALWQSARLDATPCDLVPHRQSRQLLILTAPASSTLVHFGWKLPDGHWVRATFATEWIAYDEPRDRWLGILREVSDALDSVPLPVADSIRSLIGHWVYIPSEGRDGMTLPLKLSTLTGKPRFFYVEDPRLKLQQS